MKRLVCLMVAAAMLLGLAACVPTTQPNEPAATAAPGANETAQPGDSTETPAADAFPLCGAYNKRRRAARPAVIGPERAHCALHAFEQQREHREPY